MEFNSGKCEVVHLESSNKAKEYTINGRILKGVLKVIEEVKDFGCPQITEGIPMEPLICLWLWNVLELLLFLTAFTDSLPALPCSAHSAASYSLVFKGKWSPSAFPKQYPLYRPPAQWSPLIAVTHDDKYQLWQLDSLASPGTQEYTERGTHATLMQETENMKNKMHSIAGFFKAPAIPNGIGQRSIKLTVYPTHPLLSFMVRIVPSPDWFVGGNSIILCEGNQWKEELTLDLYPYDAGTDSGFTFSSPNFATVPQDKITKITAAFPNHGANSFYYPRLRHLPPMARVTLRQLMSWQSVKPPTINLNFIPRGRTAESVCSETPLDCEVSTWSSWGLCNGDCSQFGVRIRTRFIHTQPSSSGAPCPELEQKRKCIPRNCFW
ncbi:spondin-2-like [Scyliorhinus torazame]|uniref:spondin-2-like n=1 Tax=Scyliorhinus torazame TaxID=75743 RepID=UPI003B5C8463